MIKPKKRIEMLEKIIEFSIKNKLIVGLMMALLVVFGIYELSRLPIDAVPDITNNQVQVITVAPSYGATDIERLVTFPVEQANSNISGLKEIRSFSRFGLSLVTIVFEDDIDIYWARQQVAERLLLIQNQIPKSIGTPTLGPITTGLGEIYQYVVRPKSGYEKKYDETSLRTIQDWIVRRQLLGVKGVAEVSSFGGKLKQYEIAIDPNKLNSYGVSIDDVIRSLEKNNQNTGGSYIEKGPTVLFIRSEGLIGTIEDIKNISIKTNHQGTPLFLNDVADVRFGFASRYGAMCYNNQGEVSGAVVMMLKGENSSKVIENIKEKIDQIQKTLPEGVVIEPFLDRTKMVNNAIGTVETNLLEGALIVLLVLVLFLGNIRSGALVASMIPFAMLFAVIMMNLFGVSGNLMSLGALDFGLIIDGAVIIVEATMHQLMHYKSANDYQSVFTSDEMDSIVHKSASKMMRSAVFGQTIILAVYLPIFSLQGIEGKMFKPMAQTVVFALLGAFILSLTYIPMMSSFVLSKEKKQSLNFADRWMAKIESRFENLLVKVLEKPKLIFVSVIFLFVVSGIILSLMGGEFIPTLEEGDFAVESRVLTGSNISTTIASTQKATKLLLDNYPEIEKIVTKIGSGEVPTDPMPMEASDMMIILKDKKDWTSASTFSELSEKMTKTLSAVPGLSVGFQYPVQMRFNELMTGARQDVVCKIFGENLDTLSKYAERLGKLAHGIEGAENVYVEPVSGIPHIVIRYNRSVLAQYQLAVDDVNRIVNAAFAGSIAGTIYEGEKRFDMVVRLAPEKRSCLEDIQNLLIPLNNGNQIPLSQLGTVEIVDGPNQIQREETKRRIIVGLNVRNRDVESLVTDLSKKVEENIKLPHGYMITYGGAFENLKEAKNRLLIAVPISLVLIFLLLYFAFGSIKQAAMVYSAIPLSAIGGILFLALRGMPFSISAGIGFIALFGVAVLNGIVLINEFNGLRKKGMKSLYQIVVEGSKTRLRPVLMTASVASLGFLPMAISTGAGAEVQRPLATVVIGGLIVATCLTLFILPIIYLYFEPINFKKIKQKMNRKSTFIFLILLSSSMQSQSSSKPIDLSEAIQIAKEQNLSLKNEKLTAQYHHTMKNTAWNVPNSTIGLNYGQMNSIYGDQAWSFNQSIQLPLVYINQNKILDAVYKNALFNVRLKELDIEYSVSRVYSQIVVLKQKEQLMIQMDSVYKAFIDKANLKFKAGQSNIIEKSMASSLRGQSQLLLSQIQSEITIKLLEFQLLLNTTEFVLPKDKTIFFETKGSLLEKHFEEHPQLKMSNQDVIIALRNINLEKSKWLPNVNLGATSMTMKGIGADDRFYDYNSRFNAISIGLEFPLFFGYQKAVVNASKINYQKATIQHEKNLKEFESIFEQKKQAYWRAKESIILYQKNTLPNSDIMLDAANKQYYLGEINYLEWTLIVQQSFDIKMNYYSLTDHLNLLATEINYLTVK